MKRLFKSLLRRFHPLHRKRDGSHKNRPFFVQLHGSSCRGFFLFALKKRPPRKCVPKGEALFKPSGALPDQPAVEQRTNDRPDLDPLKVPQAEKQEGQQHAHNAGRAILHDLNAGDGLFEFFGNALDEQFIHLRRNIGVEHERHAHGAQHHADGIQQKAL